MSRDDFGVSQAARTSALAALLEEPIDETAPMHLRRSGRIHRDEPWCGAAGQRMTEASDCVTCPSCKVEVTKRLRRAEFAVLRKLAVSKRTMKRVLVREIAADTRRRLVEARQAEVLGACLVITDAGLKRLETGGR